MIPMRTSTIFKNRWMALLWAAGILWFAYDFAGSTPDGSSDANAASNAAAGHGAADDANKVAEVLGS